MTRRYDKMIVVPVDEVTESTPGVLRIARCQSTAATADGIGVNGTTSGGTFTYQNGGLKKTSTQSDAHRISVDIPAAARAMIAVRGTLQFDILVADIAAFVETSGSSKQFMRFVNATPTQYGPQINAVFYTQGVAAGYRSYTDNSDGESIVASAAQLALNSGFAFNSAAAGPVFYNEMEGITSDGYKTVSLSWDSQFWMWMLDGVPVSWGNRAAAFAGTPTVIRWQEQAAVTIRNIILLREPRPNPMRLGNKRIVMVTHSFGSTAQVSSVQDKNGPWGGTGNTCNDDGITPCLFRSLSERCKIYNVGVSGKSLEWHQAQITDATVSGSKPYQAYAAPPTISVSSLTGDGTTASVTTAVAHGFQTGDPVAIAGATPGGFVETDYITVTGITTFTYPNTTVSGGATGAITAALNVNQRVSRFRPHFIVIIGMTNDTLGSTVTTRVAAINAHCVAQGIVPIWVIEQNGDVIGGANDKTSNGVYAAYVAQIDTDRATDDMGKVDMWTPSGGATVNHDWVESASGKLHPTLYPAQRAYGKAIATEINRLIASPPAYAWWA